MQRYKRFIIYKQYLLFCYILLVFFVIYKQGAGVVVFLVKYNVIL